MKRRILVALLSVLCLTIPVLGRVLSYAPYSSNLSLPSINHRNSRYFALVEALPGRHPISSGQVVLYDTLGREEPRVIYPGGPGEARSISLVALDERPAPDGGVALTILIGAFTSEGLPGNAWFISSNAGATWKRINALDRQSVEQYQYEVDYGGPYSRGLAPQVYVGGPYPFVIGTYGKVYAITAEGTAKLLYGPKGLFGSLLVGRNEDSSRFIVRTGGNTIGMIDTQSPIPVSLGEIAPGNATGWITPGGSAYVQALTSGGRVLYFFQNGRRDEIARPYTAVSIPSLPYANDLSFFAVPTTHYDGAWMIQRQPAKPTRLSRHLPGSGTEVMWSDASGPEVEALHTGSDPDLLLIQVHRPRAQKERSFLDPALAIWHVGEPPPAVYDELFLVEMQTKGFVHLDADTIGDGSPFVFDSGVTPSYAVIASPVAHLVAGGGDVGQEWGIVRASFRQRLVVPGIARQRGAFGTQWQTDVIVHNPLDEPQKVKLDFIAVGDELQAAQFSTAKITLEAQEIRVLRDVVKSLFGLDSGGGSLTIEPDAGVTATSRTYTRAGAGTYGFAMPAIDYNNALSPRFPATYSAAFPGPGFRTNLLLTDTSGRGTDAELIAHGATGLIGASGVTFRAPQNGVLQMNELSASLEILGVSEGGLEIKPVRGSAIPALVAIDNRTNDPTWFPPDLPAPEVRTIPVIGHVTGALGSAFRSDLFLMNPSSHANTIMLEVKQLDTNDPPRRLTYNLGAGQTLVIRDALKTMLDMSGLARVRFSSGTASDPGVRVTSRTYVETENGGTYGCLVPPLNSFQSAAGGDTLEILGITGNSGLRTNLGLVDLNERYDGKTAAARIRLFDQKGAEIDAFDVEFPIAGGTQVNDIFNSRGLAQPEAAIIRVEVKSGLVAAYATLTDNVTNDTTYLAANLGAKAK